MKRDFEFDGSGFGYLWLCIWTTVLTVIPAVCSFRGHTARSSAGFAAIPTLTAGSCVLKERALASSFSGC